MSSESGQSPSGPADVFSARCPSRAALDLIAHTWAVLVASSLVDGPKRHSRLCAQIDGISKKALTQTLRELERSGLVERRVYPEVPPRVEYSLTPLGHSLRGPVAALTAWAEANAGPVVEARTRHARPGTTMGSRARA
jgi:DNA-binding HxlR family transcriptional regulator